MTRTNRHLLGILTAGTLLACGGGSQGAFTARDSAGVAIVESHGPVWQGAEAWQVGAEPLLRIGTVEGEPEYQLHDVQGAVRLPNGSLALANAGSNEIRFYDDRGRFIRAVGRAGDAPGEYRLITGLGVGPGDSLWVFDYGSRRLTVLTHDGGFVRLVTLGATLSAPNAIGRFTDGSFALKEEWSFGHQDERRAGLTRGITAVTHMSPDGSTLDTIVTVRGREVFLSDENGRAVMSAPLFARASSAAVSGNDVYVGDQEVFQILRYSTDGVLRQIIRKTGVDLGITRADVDLLIERELDRVPESRRAGTRAHLESMDLPPTRPAYGQFLVDEEGNLWTAEPTRYPYPARSWTVFASEGQLLGVVEMPERFRLHQVGPDWVLGGWRDELDVEFVVLFPLRKGE